jgi:acetyltransferase (GNAT) family protein
VTVRLLPMTPAAFDRYMETAVKEYAQAHIDAGDCEPEEALPLAQADYDTLLPEGLRTKDHYLLSIHIGDSVEPIGLIWFAVRQKLSKKSAFIYDFAIRPEFRRRARGRNLARDRDPDRGDGNRADRPQRDGRESRRARSL